jgi:hypothetical protein
LHGSTLRTTCSKRHCTYSMHASLAMCESIFFPKSLTPLFFYFIIYFFCGSFQGMTVVFMLCSIWSFWDGMKMDIKFDLVSVFQCPFPFFISLIHIWHHFSFGLFFFRPRLPTIGRLWLASSSYHQ